MGKKINTAYENCIQLPEYCYSVLNITGELIMLKRGESGYNTIKENAELLAYMEKEQATTEDIATIINEQKKITPAMRRCFQVGTMWGWESEGANLQNYDENDKLIPRWERS